MDTTDDLLKQILAAQLAQVALLQAIAASVGVQVGQEHGPEAIGKVDWAAAIKALETSGFHLSTR